MQGGDPMSEYTDRMRDVAWRIYEDSLAIENRWQRRQFREYEISKLTQDDRYYVKAYIHQYTVKDRKNNTNHMWNRPVE